MFYKVGNRRFKRDFPRKREIIYEKIQFSSKKYLIFGKRFHIIHL